jgi:hypothetical protein
VNENETPEPETPEPETEEVIEEEPKATKLTPDDVEDELKKDTVEFLDRVQEAGLTGVKTLGEAILTRAFAGFNGFVDGLTGKNPPKE